MASQPIAADAAFAYRRSPSADEAFAEWLKDHGQEMPTHDQRWDVSNSALYQQDTWQPIFAEMRAKAPVNRVEGTPFGSFWNVTTVESIQHVESLPEVYSSSWERGGITIGDPPKDVTPEQLAERRLPMFIAMDRPEHTGQRRTVSEGFTPSEVAKMEAEIRLRTAGVLDSLPWDQQFDWVDKVSIELTTGMLAILFGFPWEDRRLLTYWSDWAGHTEIAFARELHDLRWSVFGEMAQYFQKIWMERMGQAPGRDLISMMIHSDAMNRMSPQEFMGNLILLIVGGNDTTRNTMSGIVHALDTFPDQRALFEADPSVITNGVQECIRYVTPLAHMRRTATQDADLFGNQVKAGDKVALWYISGNRDESVFPNADKLDLTRENARRHVAFGYGIHRCVGARLAELQLRVLMEELHARRMRVNLTGRVERTRNNFVHGHTRMEVTLSKF